MRSIVSALASALAVLVMMAPGVATATASENDEVSKPRKFEEIEKGFHIDAQIGALVLFSPKNQANGGVSPGLTIDVGLGYDISDRFALDVFLMGSNIATPSGFVSDNGQQGDISAFSIGLMGTYAFFGHPDDNGVDRLFLDGHVGAGVSLMRPKDIYESMDIMVRAGVGLEYFTRLRHFSVGVDLDFTYFVKNLGAGILILPNMKYTF